MNNEEIVEECSACGYPAKDLFTSKHPDYYSNNPQLIEYKFCNICGNTHGASTVLYQATDRTNNDVVKTMCYIANKLLDNNKDKLLSHFQGKGYKSHEEIIKIINDIL